MYYIKNALNLKILVICDSVGLHIFSKWLAVLFHDPYMTSKLALGEENA